MDKNLIRAMAEEYTEFLRDESRMVGKAESISFPQCEKEMVHIVKKMVDRQIPITLQGGRTGLAAGAVPLKGHVMNTSRMDKIVGMRKDDQGSYYLRLQPGITLSQLRKKIEMKAFDHHDWKVDDKKAYIEFCEEPEYFFSPDPTEASATLGGMVACNASGARSYHYGSIRSYVTSLRLVLANGDTVEIKRGTIIAKGREAELMTEQGNLLKLKLPQYQSPSIKNASGYYVADDMDVIDLFIGSDGTLAIISEIEVKLLKMPPVVWGISCFFTQEALAVNFVKEIRKKTDKVASIEYFDGDALEILRVQKKKGLTFANLPDISPEMKAAVYVEIHVETTQEAIELLKLLKKKIKKADGDTKHTWVARVDVDRDRLLFFRHAIPESVNMLIDERKKDCPTITKLGTDMAVPDEFLDWVINVYREKLKAKGIRSAVWGHIGDNHLHVNLLPRNEKEYELGKEIYAEWASEISKVGGVVSAEHGVGKLKYQFLETMYGSAAVEQMRSLKQIFDPLEILGRGNLFSFTEGQEEKK
ncbi:FAD-binding oxidoreductase [Tindallia californiensis]|uniref:D-lactate dehydrogenase (cytochrome) n=1 Tax=Tindallia californiensis TaxID=159292 RepID=A0A1H3MXX5_9FIRM|nr:FAD-binding oxidoreductase [Tindallia californiensis]SDY81075.1 D-lactate dehydrogenase (cytochrome) [Tindallia californiensis]